MPASMKSLAAAKHATGHVASVLGLWRQDKRYYSVQVTDCDQEARNCQVIFDDGYKCWLEAKELHCELVFDKLDEAEIVCCVCEGDNSEPPNDIIMCDSCQQGYHLMCHQPAVDRAQVEPGDDQIEWVCYTCQQIASHAAGLPDVNSSPVHSGAAGSSSSVLASKKQSTSSPSASKNKKTPAKTQVKSAVAKTPKRKSAAAAADPQTSQSATKSAANKTRATPSKTARVATPKIKLNKRISQKTSEDKKEQCLEQAESQMANMDLDEQKKVTSDGRLGIIVNQPGPLRNVKKDFQEIKSLANVDSLCSFNGHDANNDISNTKKPTQPHEGRVEEMSPLIIQTARALAKEPECIGTDQFVHVIAEDHKLMESLRASSKGGQVSSRKKTKPSNAAAY